MLAVASSINMILLFLSTALAIHNSYFSPALKLSPPSVRWVSNPDWLLTNSLRQHSPNAYITSSSLLIPYGSKFALTVPSNMVASCIIMVTDSLSYVNVTSVILIPSMDMLPWDVSNMRNIARVIVDLPAPVLPTTPNFVLDGMTIDIFFNAAYSPAL